MAEGGRPVITAERARELLDYDPDTGVLTRKVRTSRNTRVGDVAGFRMKNGYLGLCLLGRQYYAHRIAWLIATGEWPDDQIDHVNGDRTDNRLSNLRSVDNAANAQNREARGYYLDKRRGRWAARVTLDYRTIHLGEFATEEAARAAYVAAKAEHHPHADRTARSRHLSRG